MKSILASVGIMITGLSIHSVAAISKTAVPKTSDGPTIQEPIRYGTANIKVTKALLEMKEGRPVFSTQPICESNFSFPVYDMRSIQGSQVNFVPLNCDFSADGKSQRVTVYAVAMLVSDKATSKDYKKFNLFSYISNDNGQGSASFPDLPTQSAAVEDLDLKKIVLNSEPGQYAFCLSEGGSSSNGNEDTQAFTKKVMNSTNNSGGPSAQENGDNSCGIHNPAVINVEAVLTDSI